MKTKLLLLALAGCLLATARATTFDLSTATIADINAAFDAGALNSEKLVQLYINRIEAYNGKNGLNLNTIITLNPKALETARALDAERKAKGPRSPLHGIPILVKDVYDTYDMPTTGGFKPMATSQPTRDSFTVNRLREAGAIILGKTNQADWYGNAVLAGSSLQGAVLSPYNPKKYPGASSSGTGVAMAAWFATVGLGSDTNGSIVIPSTLNNIVGIAGTHGLVSRTGMMWSSPSEENAGPMGRSLYDCAVVLNVMAGYDAADLATQASIGKIPDQPYVSFIDKDGLRGARIGVLREMVRTGPQHAEGDALFEQAVADFRKAGAVLVDPALTGLNLPAEQAAAGAFRYEQDFAINKYLSGLPPDAPIHNVDEMIAKGGDLVQRGIVNATKIKSLDHNKEMAAALKQQEMLHNALVALMDKYELDALILPYRTAVDQAAGDPNAPVGVRRNPAGAAPGATAGTPAATPAGAAGPGAAGGRRGGGGTGGDTANQLHAYTGLPTIVVPGGFYASDGMPFAVQFLGRPFSEPTLIKLASGYEAATHHRKAPDSTPPLPGEHFEY